MKQKLNVDAIIAWSYMLECTEHGLDNDTNKETELAFCQLMLELTTLYFKEGHVTLKVRQAELLMGSTRWKGGTEW
jgi:hypothetical protein